MASVKERMAMFGGSGGGAKKDAPAAGSAAGDKPVPAWRQAMLDKKKAAAEKEAAEKAAKEAKIPAWKKKKAATQAPAPAVAAKAATQAPARAVAAKATPQPAPAAASTAPTTTTEKKLPAWKQKMLDDKKRAAEREAQAKAAKEAKLAATMKNVKVQPKVAAKPASFKTPAAAKTGAAPSVAKKTAKPVPTATAAKTKTWSRPAAKPAQAVSVSATTAAAQSVPRTKASSASAKPSLPEVDENAVPAAEPATTTTTKIVDALPSRVDSMTHMSMSRPRITSNNRRTPSQRKLSHKELNTASDDALL